MKFLVMDVDGTLTDGKIYIGNDGELMKAFNVIDGCGIKDILPQYSIVPVVITARNSKILQHRCEELGIVEFYQGISNKKNKLTEIIESYNKKYNTNYSYKDCAYIGDDILDIECMNYISTSGGKVGCPLNAVKEVKAVADFISLKRAGEGAVRDFIEWLVMPKINDSLLKERILNAIEYLKNLNVNNIVTDERIYVNEYFYFSIQRYDTKPENDCELESHRKCVDIQIIVSGEEVMDLADIARLDIKEEYDIEKDVVLWNIPNRMARTSLKAGDCIVLYPENAHRGAVAEKTSSRVIKIVGKVVI